MDRDCDSPAGRARTHPEAGTARQGRRLAEPRLDDGHRQSIAVNTGPNRAPDTKTTLAELEKAGIVTYRDYADEYRIWQGTDVDINLLLDAARQRVNKQPLVEILNRIDQPQPMVAARHSAKQDVLRVFKRRYADADAHVEPLEAFSRYDGEVLLLVDSEC